MTDATDKNILFVDDEASIVIVRPDGHIAARIMGDSVTSADIKDALSNAVVKFVTFD